MAPLKKRVEAAERKIAELEEKEKELSDQLSSGGPGVDLAATGSQLRSIQMQLHKTALDWEADATALEALQNQLDGELAAL
jgi:hypothetical protein